jgi:hypothetical protein
VHALDEPVAWDDWSDVVKRSRRSRPFGGLVRGVVVAAVAAGIAAVSAVSVLLLTPTLLHPAGPGAGRLTSARRPSPAATARAHVVDVLRMSNGAQIYVSRSVRGGFCYGWAPSMHACEPKAAPLEVSWGKSRIVGAVSSADVSSVTIEFADGTSARADISWIGGPVRAGFFVYKLTSGKIVADVVADDRGQTRGEDPWYSV